MNKSSVDEEETVYIAVWRTKMMMSPVPPTVNLKGFKNKDDALEFAKNHYGTVSEVTIS